MLILGAAFAISVRLERLGAQSLEERALTIGLFDALIVPAAPIGEGYHYVLIFPAVLIAFRLLTPPERAFLQRGAIAQRA